MILRCTLCLVPAALLLVGCSPRKEPKPSASTDANTAYSAANEGRATMDPTASPVVSKTPPAPAGKSALPVLGAEPAWKVTTLDGHVLSADQLKGKVVVVDFWATWCPPCREEIPGYVDLYRKYGQDKLVIVGMSVDEGGPQVVKDFVAKFRVNYPVAMADDSVQSEFGGMDAIPTTFLIDQKGQIRDKKVGAEATDVYEKKIASLLE